MLLFRSEEHLGRWLASKSVPRGGTMTLAQCQDLGRTWYSDKAEPGWRRKTLDEAQAAFADIGLTGEFWRLG